MQQAIENDLATLTAVIAATGAGLVMIDGCTLAGKTWLARHLAARLSAVAMDVDDFIKRRQDAFLDALRAGELKTAVDAALSSSPIVLLSGICARDVADKAALSPTLHVYVQRNTTVGVVADMDIIDAEDGVQNEFPNALDAEIADYHRRQHPRRNAHLLYIWVAD